MHMLRRDNPRRKTGMSYMPGRSTDEQRRIQKPTAEIAVHRASRMPRHIWNVFKELNLAAGKSGVEVTEIRDKETGKKYRR